MYTCAKAVIHIHVQRIVQGCMGGGMCSDEKESRHGHTHIRNAYAHMHVEA